MPAQQTPCVVQLCLDDGKSGIRVAAIVDWFDHQTIELPVLRFRTTSRDAVLYLEFKNSSDAEAFSNAFPGAVVLMHTTAAEA